MPKSLTAREVTRASYLRGLSENHKMLTRVLKDEKIGHPNSLTILKMCFVHVPPTAKHMAEYFAMESPGVRRVRHAPFVLRLPRPDNALFSLMTS